MSRFVVVVVAVFIVFVVVGRHIAKPIHRKCDARDVRKDYWVNVFFFLYSLRNVAVWMYSSERSERMLSKSVGSSGGIGACVFFISFHFI